MPVLRHIYDSATGTYVDVEVSPEVYNCYCRMGQDIQHNNSRFYEHEVQFTSLLGCADESFESFCEFLANELDPEHILCHDIPEQVLFDALTQLTAAECYLLQALVLDGYNEGRFAQRTGLPQKTIQNRKTRAIRKLRGQLLREQMQ